MKNRFLGIFICCLIAGAAQAATKTELYNGNAYAFLDKEDSKALYKALEGQPGRSFQTTDKAVGIFCSIPKGRNPNPADNPSCFVSIHLNRANYTKIKQIGNTSVRAKLDQVDSGDLFEALKIEPSKDRFRKRFKTHDSQFSLSCQQKTQPETCTFVIRLEKQE